MESIVTVSRRNAGRDLLLVGSGLAILTAFLQVDLGEHHPIFIDTPHLSALPKLTWQESAVLGYVGILAFYASSRFLPSHTYAKKTVTVEPSDYRQDYDETYNDGNLN